MTGLIVDNFAGGGGASTGIEQALGRCVDIAINHDEEAIRMHEVNHPGTRHIRNNIWQIDPLEVTGGEPVELAWFSPDCKHFSKAKGGKPREKSIRDLAWVVPLWAAKVRPAVMFLENVEEFRTWCEVDHETGQPIKAQSDAGQAPLFACEGRPAAQAKKRKQPKPNGETFDKWCRELRRLGYRLQFRELRACDYGAPTIRKRFFMIARRDGKPIVWPAPTHGKPGSPEVLAGKRLPWRTAAEIIDWSIPCPSIFERKKPLADKTLRRIAHGIMKFVVNNPRPFIVPLTHGGGETRAYSPDDPIPTVTGANRGEMAVVAPHITKFRSGAIGHEVTDPLATVTANSFIKRPGGCAPLGLVEATCAPFTSYAQQGGANRSVEDPLHTVTASDGDHNTVVGAVLTPFYGDKDGRPRAANAVDEPLRTQTLENRFGAVTAFMQKFASGNAPTGAAEPIQTVEGNAKHSVVAVHIEQANGDGERSRPGRSADEPLSTVTTEGAHQRVVCAHLEQANGSPEGQKPLPGRGADAPLATIVAKGSTQRLVTSNLVKLRGGEGSHDVSSSVSVEAPLHTVCAGGTHMAEVRAFLLKYYGTDQDPRLEEPLHSVTTKDRFGLVTVTIEGEEYVIVDIGMRMLTPRELFNAQGFPPDYIIDRDIDGRPITKTAQVAKCGNSVCPPIARALVSANVAALADDAELAA